MFFQNKEDEIHLLRGLVRQQEDSTRLLGEKMRNEAQEHVSIDVRFKTAPRTCGEFSGQHGVFDFKQKYLES